MDCPNCGTWNPDDKIRCWRCNAELPKPELPKKKKAAFNAAWLWVAVVVVVLLCTLAQCFVMQQGNASDATSFLPPVISTQPAPF